MSRLKWFVLLVSSIFTLDAPAQVVLQGRVVDAESRTPVPFASIFITNTSIGTASDESGVFQLKLTDAESKEKMVVSSIGYRNAFLSIDSLLRQSEKRTIIRLAPFTQYLAEVVVNEKRLSPEALLKEAMAAIPKNYSQKPFNLEYYSRMLVKDTVSTVYDLETILLVYRKGYIGGETFNWTKALEKREHGSSPFPPARIKKTNKEYFTFFPGFDILLVDNMGADKEGGYTVFNPKIFDRMNFKYAGHSVFDQDTVVRIEYSRRKKDLEIEPGEDVKYGGVIYIATNTLAIVRHMFGFGTIRLDVIYKKVNGTYFPYSIKTHRLYNFDKKLYVIDHTVSLRRVIQDNVQVIEWSSDHWIMDVPYREAFWEENYPRSGKGEAGGKEGG